MIAVLAVLAAALVLGGVRVRVALSWRHGAALAAVLAAAAAPGAGPGIVPLAAAAAVVAFLAAAGALALVLVLARRTVPACLRGCVMMPGEFYDPFDMSRDEFDYAFDRYDELECIEFERAMRLRRPQLTLVPAPAPQAEISRAATDFGRPPRRCRACGYARGALGHQVTCQAGAA